MSKPERSPEEVRAFMTAMARDSSLTDQRSPGSQQLGNRFVGRDDTTYRTPLEFYIPTDSGLFKTLTRLAATSRDARDIWKRPLNYKVTNTYVDQRDEKQQTAPFQATIQERARRNLLDSSTAWYTGGFAVDRSSTSGDTYDSRAYEMRGLQGRLPPLPMGHEWWLTRPDSVPWHVSDQAMDAASAHAARAPRPQPTPEQPSEQTPEQRARDARISAAADERVTTRAEVARDLKRYRETGEVTQPRKR